MHSSACLRYLAQISFNFCDIQRLYRNFCFSISISRQRFGQRGFTLQFLVWSHTLSQGWKQMTGCSQTWSIRMAWHLSPLQQGFKEGFNIIVRFVVKDSTSGCSVGLTNTLGSEGKGFWSHCRHRADACGLERQILSQIWRTDLGSCGISG